MRFIGVTRHGWTIPSMHKRSIARFDFDSILLPYNYVMNANEHYRQDFEALLKACARRNVAVQTIKASRPGRGRPPSPATTRGISRQRRQAPR